MNVQHLREELDNSSGVSYTALNKSILISSGTWTDVGKTALSVYDLSLRNTVDRQVIPVSRGLEYWKQIKYSGPVGIGLCWLQNFPILLKDGFHAHNFHLSQLRPSNITKNGWNSWFYFFKSINSFLRGPVIKLADQNLAKLNGSYQQSTETVGKLLECWQQAGSLDATISQGVHDMANTIGIKVQESPSVNEEQVLQTLQTILDHINQRGQLDDTIPGFWARWWPLLTVGLFSGGIVLGSWRSIVSWFSTNIVETTKLFLENWVYEPLLQIYYTIRLDPKSEVALMSKGSLEADLESLQRMVIDFAHDNSSNVSDEAIKTALSQGDLEPVMRVYEKEMASPVLSLLKGGLIRSLLIQVQKTKVDAEFAVKAINQLIQSQQLGLGVIAALPALAAVYLTVTGGISYAKGTGDIKGALQSQGAKKDVIMLKFGAIEELALDKPHLGYRDMGEVYCIVAEVRRFASKSFSRERYTQFCKDLDRLVGVSSSESILATLTRIYAKY